MEIKTGDNYKHWIAKYIISNFGNRSIDVYSEVRIGKSIIGKNRTVDLLILDRIGNRALALECKLQLTSGTADEKIPYTLKDAESMQMDKYVVYGGQGWSKGVRHMLEAHELACNAQPENLDNALFTRTVSTRELNNCSK